MQQCLDQSQKPKTKAKNTYLDAFVVYKPKSKNQK
jgi:hypothetical protein